MPLVLFGMDHVADFDRDLLVERGDGDHVVVGHPRLRRGVRVVVVEQHELAALADRLAPAKGQHVDHRAGLVRARHPQHLRVRVVLAAFEPRGDETIP